MNLAEAVTEAFSICHGFGHQNEQLPKTFLRKLCKGIDSQFAGAGIGLVTCLVGVANIGAQEIGGEDPAGLDWKGQRARSGKHWLDGGSDYPYGGLGIVHLDSSGLRKHAYEWARLELGMAPPDTGEMHFNAILGSTKRRQYLDWADEVLDELSFHVWLVEYWLRKFWSPAWAWASALPTKDFWPEPRPGVAGEEYAQAERVDLAAVNARIANSLSAVDDPLREGQVFDGKRWVDDPDGKMTVEEQIDTYANYKAKRYAHDPEKAERSSARARRQAKQAQRVAVIYRELHVPVFP